MYEEDIIELTVDKSLFLTNFTQVGGGIRDRVNILGSDQQPIKQAVSTRFGSKQKVFDLAGLFKSIGLIPDGLVQYWQHHDLIMDGFLFYLASQQRPFSTAAKLIFGMSNTMRREDCTVF